MTDHTLPIAPYRDALPALVAAITQPTEQHRLATETARRIMGDDLVGFHLALWEEAGGATREYRRWLEEHGDD